MRKADERSSGYGSYGGYYYGEGYGTGYADAAVTPSRGLKDYLIILRERIWWLVTTVFVVFLAVALYTFNSPKQFLAMASIQLLRSPESSLGVQGATEEYMRVTEDVQTQVNLFESLEIVKGVGDRIQGQLRRRFLAPYEDGIDVTFRPRLEITDILYRNRDIRPERMSLIVHVTYKHPNPQVAAEVANLFAEQFLQYSAGQITDTNLGSVEMLAQQVKVQADKVRVVEERISDFMEAHGLSFEEGKDVETQELIQLRTIATEAKRNFDRSQAMYDLVVGAGEDYDRLEQVLESADTVTKGDSRALKNHLSQLRIEQATLARRYGPKHPRMVAARESVARAEEEYRNVLEISRRGILNGYERSRAEYDSALGNLARAEQKILVRDRLRPEYNALLRDKAINQTTYQAINERYQVLLAMSNTMGDKARIIDRAFPPGSHHTPNTIMNLGLGLVLGLGMGFGLVILLAILDDKVKTAFDIETTIGVPLVGIVPRISIVDATEKARVVADNLDKHSVEAFRAIHSTLKLNEESRNAKVILTTSTIPSEGKSFVSTNMAFTFAAHGERTLVMDCDLRMPNVGKSLNIANRKGLLQLLEGQAQLDDVILKDVEPGLDVLVTGGRSKNPTQVLSSERFENLLHELRNRYDKIMIDCPPLAPVSDALNILSLVDGVIYVVRFNMVKRKTAMINVRRLRESNVPILGAVLNNINTNVAGYYYSHYYDSSYRHYYVQGSSASVAETEEETTSRGS
jgi:polysaccharide biosynthesis transport protein